MPRKKVPRKKKKKTDPHLKTLKVCGCCFEKCSTKGSTKAVKLHTCSSCQVKWHDSCCKGRSPKLCDVCEAGFVENPPRCALCMKSDRRGFYKQTIEDEWAHVICATWGNTSFLNDDDLIEGVGEMDRAYFTLKCNICKKRGGACTQCVYGRCSKSVHPLCAITSDAFLMIEVALEKLTKKELDRYVEIMQIEDSSQVNTSRVQRFLYCSEHKKHYNPKDPCKDVVSTKKQQKNIRKRRRNSKNKGSDRKKPRVDKLVWNSKFYNGVRFLFVDY